MLEPQNDEERKALRLLRQSIPDADGFQTERWRDDLLSMLAEARIIVREEQAGGLQPEEVSAVREREKHWHKLCRTVFHALGVCYCTDYCCEPSEADTAIKRIEELARREHEWLDMQIERDEDRELAQIRADITRTAAVVRALSASGSTCTKGKLVDEWAKQDDELLRLLSCERELMAKSEPEGGK